MYPREFSKFKLTTNCSFSWKPYLPARITRSAHLIAKTCLHARITRIVRSSLRSQSNNLWQQQQGRGWKTGKDRNGKLGRTTETIGMWATNKKVSNVCSMSTSSFFAALFSFLFDNGQEGRLRGVVLAGSSALWRMGTVYLRTQLQDNITTTHTDVQPGPSSDLCLTRPGHGAVRLVTQGAACFGAVEVVSPQGCSGRG